MVEDISFHLPLTLTKSLSESTCEIIISNDSLVLAESNMEGGYYNNDTVRKANVIFSYSGITYFDNAETKL